MCPAQADVQRGLSGFDNVRAPFLDEDVIPMDYVEAASLYNLCLDKEVQCGSTDILISAVAKRKNFTVLTYDQALIRCLKTLKIPHL